MLLPLFPLNTVLFPGMPLTLHIFEERYKLMISRCIAEQSPFGVVLIRSGSEVQGLGPSAEPYQVGCTAIITQVQKTELNRINLIAVGRQRFFIEELDKSLPYLQGHVRILQAAEHTHHETESEILGSLIQRYLRAVARQENLDFESVQLPPDSASLAYLGASVLRLDLGEKQRLLEIEHLPDLIRQVTAMFRKELALLHILSQSKTYEGGVFSLN
ncbi:LON peptidase substrate-binding domain-containing protein [Kamptonema cortianum]|nr:LON peptidase substrate-binding domain-containing protein [Kamptonema cortianum]